MTIGTRERPRRAQRLNRCRDCGSIDFFSAHFDADGLAVTDGSGDYLTVCNGCGTFYLVGTRDRSTS